MPVRHAALVRFSHRRQASLEIISALALVDLALTDFLPEQILRAGLVLPKCAKTRGEDLSGRLCQFAEPAELQQSQQHAIDYK